MGKKDKTIERILAQYAEEVKPSPSIVSDAKRAAEEKRRGQDRQAAKKPSRLPRFAAFFAVAASALIVVVSLLFVYNYIPKNSGGNNNDASPDPQPPVTEYYGETDLYMKAVTKEEAVAAVGKIRFMESDGILGEEYKLYSFKEDGTPAFVMGRLRIKSERGVDDVSVIAEVTDKVIKNFKYMTALPETALGRGSTHYDSTTGEYVTYAYRRDNAVKYYLHVMSPTGLRPDDYLEMLK